MQLRRSTVAIVSAGCLLAGCMSVPYYWQAVGGQVEILRKRTPIESMLADTSVDADLKSTLESVSAIRLFAIDELHLPDNDSYTTYADLERPYVVWNVVATEEFSVEAERWCFPFAGCVRYRGYFDRARAEAFQSKLMAQGYDTYRGGSRAYSTLGYLKDPVLNTMLENGTTYVASLLFHELAHQKVYFRDDSDLSEAFASLIEEIGTERWLALVADDKAVAEYRAARLRRAEFADLVARQQERLRALYALGLPAGETRRRKARAFDEMRVEYSALKEDWGGRGDYDEWFGSELNNASLAAVSTYTRWLPVLRNRLERVGLPSFYDEMAALAELPSERRRSRLETLAAGMDER